MNDVEYVLRIVLKARDEMAKVLAKARTELIGFTSAAKKGSSDIDGLNTRISSLNRRMGNLIDRFQKAGAAVHKFASQKRDADELLERNVTLMGKLADSARDLGRGFRQASGDADRMARSTKRSSQDADEAGSSFTRLFRTFNNGSGSVAALDNKLRGVGLLLVAAFAQQLITVLVGLGGSLVAVAGSAAMAGSAIGGGLTAGIAQALPMVGLLVAGLARVKVVMDAVQQAQKFQQAQFVQGAKDGKASADSADAIANAQDSLRDALERVESAHDRAVKADRQHQVAVDNLREARARAKDDLEELILAEKRAELAARGAVLSQREAAEQLRQATLGGRLIDVDRASLDVADAQISREETLIKLRNQRRETRTAVAAGPDQTEDVRNAAAQLEDSEQQLKEAQRGIRDAEQAVTRANRGLNSARRSTAEGAASITTAASQLEYALSLLSPAERRLYEATIRIRDTWKDIYRPITDLIVDSFTRTVDRVNKVLKMPSVVAEARASSKEIGKSFNTITDAFTTDELLSQFTRIAAEGRRNLEPLTQIFIRFGRSFLNIAELAGPAFRRFIDFIGRLSDRFENLTSNRQGVTDFFIEGEKHFEAWIELGLSVIKLFFAISQAGGAESGLRSISDATTAIDDLTRKVNANKGEVAKFFEDARKVTYEVVRAIVALGKELIKSFSPAHARNFADILIDVVIPAIGMVIRGVGLLVNLVSDLLSNPVVSTLAKWGVSFLILGTLAGSMTKALLGAVTMFGKFFKAIGLIIGLIPRLAPLSALLAELVIFGPALLVMAAWPLAIAAGVVVLLGSLGLLDDVMRAIGGFFTSFFSQLEKPIDRLGKAFNDLTGSGEGVNVVIGYLREFLRVIIDVGGRLFRIFGAELGSLIGGAIDVFAGFVKIIDGILNLDLGRVLDGVTDMFKGWLNAWTGFFTAPFKEWFGGGEDAKKTASDIEGAAKKVKQAEQDLAKSQKASAEAQRDLTDARRDARRELSDLESRATGGKLQVREARFSLQDAQNELRTLRSRGAAQGEIARAELRVEQARQSLKDTTRDATRSEQDYADARRKGVKGNEGVVKAQADADAAALKARRDKEKKESDEWHLWAKKELRKNAKDEGKGFIDGFLDGVGNLAGSIVGLFEDMFNSVLGFLGIKSPSTLFRSVGRDMLDGIVGGFVGFGSRIIGIITRAIPGVIRSIGGLVKDAVGWLGNKLGIGGGEDKVEAVKPINIPNPLVSAPANTGAKEMEKTRDAFIAAWRDMRNESRRGSSYVEKQYRDMRVNTTNSMDRMFRDIRGSLADIENSFDRRGARIEKSWADTWDSLDKSTYEGLSYIAGQTNKSLDALGEDKISFGLRKPGVEKRQRGGMIDGSGDGDKRLVLAEPGEGFINKRAVRAMGGPSVINAINAMIPRFQKGGIVSIPGMPGEEAAASIIPTLVRLIRQYRALVTDAYDRDRSAGHKSPGHNITGTAVDMVPGPGGNWNLIEAMGRWAVSRGLVVGYGAGIPGSQPWAGHGRGHHIHIEFKGGGGGSIGGMLGADINTNVGRPRITGGGKLGEIGQSVIDQVRKASNNKLDGAGSVEAGGDYPAGKMGKGGALSASQVQGYIRKALEMLDMTRNVGLWVRTLTRQAFRESTFNPNAVNNWDINAKRGDPSKGLIQIIGANFKRYMVKGHSNVFNPLDNILAVIRYTIDRYGQGNADRAVNTLWARGGGAYARGGEIPGGEGKPVGILAHAGEWILNRLQQSRLAQLMGTGTSTLSSMLGFHGKGGEQGYAGGGVLHVGDSLGVGMQKALDKLVDGLVSDVKGGRNSDQGFDVLKKKLKKAYTDVIFDLGTNDAHAETLAKNLRKAYRLLGKDQDLIVSTVRGPNAAAKNKVIRDFASKHENVEVLDWANRGKNLVGPDGIHSTPAGYAKRAKMIADEVKKNDEIAKKAKASVDPNSFTLSDDVFRSLTDLMGDVQTVFGKIRTTQKKLPNRVRAFVDLVDKLSSEGGVFDQIRAAIERNVTQRARRLLLDRFSVGAGRVVSSDLSDSEVAQRQLDDLRTNRGELISERDNIGSALASVQKRQARGLTEGLTEAQRRLLQNQENLLQGQYDEATQNIAENVEAIFEAQQALLQAVIQQQQDIVDEINKRYERITKYQDFGRRIATALGNEDVISALNAAQRDTLTAQAREIEAQIYQAYSIGAVDLADALTSQFLDLAATIAESAAQEVRDSADRVNTRAQRRLGRLDLAGRLLDATGTVGQTAAVALGGEAFSRAGIFAQRGQVLEGQRSDLQGVLRAAEAQGNIGLVQDLTDQLAELDVSIKENTKAAFSAKFDALNQSTGFNLGVNDLNKQILELEGQISGNTNQAAILSGLQERQNILLAQRQGLEALLAEAQKAGDQQAVNDLTTAILENKVATLQNTQAINTASGSLTDPQTFSSSAWTLFREAIFNGMGQILPQFDVTSGTASGALTRSGALGTSNFAPRSTTNTSSVNGGDTNINLYGYEKPVDPTEISSVIGFAKKTSQ